MNSPEPINIGVSHQIGHYADAIRVLAGYEQIITSGTPHLLAEPGVGKARTGVGKTTCSTT